MNRICLRLLSCAAILSLMCVTGWAQGRGRGRGLGRSDDVFVSQRNRTDRFERLGRNQNWKCGKFVNCHDARDGRVDGRGRRVNAFNNGIFTSRGDRVGYRYRRYNMNDYWRRRHTVYGSGYYRMRRPR